MLFNRANNFLFKIIFILFLVTITGCGEIPLLDRLTDKNPSTLVVKENSFRPKKIDGKLLRKDGAMNIAVAPGGGLNAYTSLYLGKVFSEHTGKHFDEMFDLFWGLSGGAIAGTLLMNKEYKHILENFKAQAQTAFPDVVGVIKGALANKASMDEVLRDADKKRIDVFEKAIVTNLKDIKFGKNAGNRFVLVASAEEKTVCYADSTIKLPKNCFFRAPEGTRVADGIIGSSNYQLDKKDMLTGLSPELEALADHLPESASLFFKRPASLLPDNKEHEIIDGVFANPDDLDGSSPLPLAIDYLLQFESKSEHNLIVFDNGSAGHATYSNEKFRKSIKMDDNGYARIEKNNVIINVFLIKITVREDQFEEWMYDKRPIHWTLTETYVNEQIKGTRKDIFDRAIKAIKSTI
jgi:hypothetical protein